MELGSHPWRKDRDGSYSGNPSISSTVSIYMKSLQKKKVSSFRSSSFKMSIINNIFQVRAGTVSQSARAIDANLLFRLYEHNKQHKIASQLHRLGIDEQGARFWGGAAQRMMMSVAYVLSFLCLLRFDEVLHIQAHHIELIDEEKGKIASWLKFRKTHQEGGM